MPRPKRTVGFWRGTPSLTKTSLLPPVDRYTGTPVDSWPPGYRHQLRAHLLALRRRKPNLDAAELLVAARKWAAERQRPAGIPKTIGPKHTEVLLTPPRSRSSVAKSQAKAPRDRTRRPTTLSGEQIAATISKSRRATPRPSPTQNDKRPRGRGTAGKTKSQARPIPPKPTIPADPSLSRDASADVRATRSIAVTAVRRRRDTLEVTWTTLAGAARAHVDLLGPDGTRLRRVTTGADATPLRIGKVAVLPQPMRVAVLISLPGGGILARGTTAIDLR